MMRETDISITLQMCYVEWSHAEVGLVCESTMLEMMEVMLAASLVFLTKSI